MDITTREVEPGLLVIALDGRWDAQTTPNVEEIITEQIKTNCRILLDLGRVSYMSSAALRTLVLIYREVHEKNDCQLVLAAISDRLRDVMEITGFIDYVELYPTVDAGLAALRG